MAVNCSEILLNRMDGCGVANEGGSHLKTPWWDVTDSSLDIVGDPFNEVAAVLVLDVQHLLVHLLHRHPAAEHRGHREVPAVPGVASRHHVLRVEHLLGELGDGEGPVLLAAPGCEGGEAGHEEVEAGEGNHVHCKLPKVGIQLAGEPEAGGYTGHGEGDKVVEVAVGGCGQLQGAEADVVQRLVVNAECLVCVLNQLVDGEGGVVRLHHCVGHLWAGDHAVCVHDPVRIFLPDL